MAKVIMFPFFTYSYLYLHSLASALEALETCSSVLLEKMSARIWRKVVWISLRPPELHPYCRLLKSPFYIICILLSFIIMCFTCQRLLPASSLKSSHASRVKWEKLIRLISCHKLSSRIEDNFILWRFLNYKMRTKNFKGMMTLGGGKVKRGRMEDEWGFAFRFQRMHFLFFHQLRVGAKNTTFPFSSSAHTHSTST